MSDDEIKDNLEVIIQKMDRMLSFLRIALVDKIEELRSQAEGDPVSNRILELADGTRAANKLKKQVAIDTEVSKKTVQRRINDLLSSGLLSQKRDGQEVYYEVTDLF